MVTTPDNVRIIDWTNGTEGYLLNFGGGYSMWSFCADMLPDGRMIFGAFGSIPTPGEYWYYIQVQKVIGQITLDTDWSTMYIHQDDFSGGGGPPVGDKNYVCRVVALTNTRWRFYIAIQVSGVWKEVYYETTDAGANWGSYKYARPTTEFTADYLDTMYFEGNTKKVVNHRRGQVTSRDDKIYYRQLTNV